MKKKGLILLIVGVGLITNKIYTQTNEEKLQKFLDSPWVQKQIQREERKSKQNLKAIQNIKSTENTTSSINDTRHASNEGGNLFLPRPQGLNSAAIFNPFLYDCCAADICNSFMLGYRFTQTTNSENIAKALFGKEKLEFQGSLVNNRNNGTAIVADYFGLEPLYSGTISFKPRIRQHHFDFALHIELGNYWNCLENSWIDLYSTLVHSNWNLNHKIANERTNNAMRALVNPQFTAAAGYPGYMGFAPTTFATKLKDVLGGDFTFGEMESPWKYGRFDLDESGRTLTKFANLDLLIGYDFQRCEDRHVGAFLRVSAPTGNRPDPRYIFNPIIGNGHHWELGFGLNMHRNIWQCDDQCVQMHFTGNLSHLFSDTQLRTFDFKNKGALSRYMLLKKFSQTPLYDLDYQELIKGKMPLENGTTYLTRKIKSSFTLQGDATIRLILNKCNFLCGIGYNIYGRSKEKISNPCIENCCQNDQLFGIKGVMGNYSNRSSGQIYEALSYTQTNANNVTINTVPDDTVSNIDNIGEEDAPYSWIGERYPSIKTATFSPTFINCEKDLDKKAIPQQIIHKVFGHIDYQWDCKDYAPFIGVYGEYDIAHNKDENFTTPSQWGIGVRGGISF